MALVYGDVTIVVDEQDDLFYTRMALQAHRPEEGRIIVQPTPASGSPAALAHDMLYALGKRLAPGPNSPDIWLDSVKKAWLAAAAWTVATGVRHVVVTRAHLLTVRRIDQLFAWREVAGVQLTLLWQKALRGLPLVLARVERRISSRDKFEALLAEPGPIPACPSFPPAVLATTGRAAVGAGQPPARPPRGAQPTSPGRRAHPCTGAMATAQLSQPAPAINLASDGTAALATLAHPLIAGALSVLAFTRAGLGGLRLTRDLDITGDVSAIKLHGVGHRNCPLYTVPAWARPLLAGARAHHRLVAHPPGNSVFAPLMLAEARHLRAHGERLPQLNLRQPGSLLAP
ncbi:hypothetical protein [Streptomyces sp. NPDC004680]|uniref:hypothetical protein n=1 Tax=Streptomyces sp. NPDC004680 TaxID=3154287 RepID=UPI0033B240AE